MRPGLAARGRSPEDRAQGPSGWLREVRRGHRGSKARPQAPSFHRDRPYQFRTKPAGRLRSPFDTSVAPLRPKSYGETGPSSLSPTPHNERALSPLRGFGPAPLRDFGSAPLRDFGSALRRLLESGPVWPYAVLWTSATGCWGRPPNYDGQLWCVGLKPRWSLCGILRLPVRTGFPFHA